MPYEFKDANGNRYRVPATLHLAQLHVGGSPRARFVRGYGSGRSFVVQDGIREPSPLNLVGILHSDRDDYSAKALLDELESAAQSATQLVLVDYFGQDVQELPLLGALPATVEPDGVDGSLLRVTLPLVPGRSSWTAPSGDQSDSSYAPPPVQDFTPADLPGLALWLDAADAASVSLNGSAVAQWADKSGNGRHFAQGSASQQPAYVPGAYNGRATVRFDGVNDNLSIGGNNNLLRAAPGATCYVVGLTTKTGGQQFFWIESNRTLFQARWQIAKTSDTGNPHILLYRQLDGDAANVFTSGVEWAVGDLHCAGAFLDLTAATRTWRVNGVEVAHEASLGTSGTFSNTNSNSAFVGAARNGTYWQGDICEIILLPRALTPTEVIKLEAYLLQKWGIT